MYSSIHHDPTCLETPPPPKQQNVNASYIDILSFLGGHDVQLVFTGLDCWTNRPPT